jgi:DNA repair protein RadC
MTALARTATPEGVESLQRLFPGAPWAEALLELGGLVGLVQAPDACLLQHLPAPAVQALRASFDVTQAFARARDERPRLVSPASIYEHLRPQLAHLGEERFVALYFNTRQTLLHQAVVGIGAVDQCTVDPRSVFAPAVLHGASGVVVAHNHPSGDASPSASDIDLTRHLQQGGRLLQVKLLDHIIVTRTGFTSLLAQGHVMSP